VYVYVCVCVCCVARTCAACVDVSVHVPCLPVYHRRSRLHIYPSVPIVYVPIVFPGVYHRRSRLHIYPSVRIVYVPMFSLVCTIAALACTSTHLYPLCMCRLFSLVCVASPLSHNTLCVTPTINRHRTHRCLPPTTYGVGSNR